MQLQELYGLYGEADIQTKVWAAKAQEYQRQIAEALNKVEKMKPEFHVNGSKQVIGEKNERKD